LAEIRLEQVRPERAVGPLDDQPALVVLLVHEHAGGELAEVGRADDDVGRCAGFAERGQKNGDENGDDANDDQKLDERKAADAMSRHGASFDEVLALERRTYVRSANSSTFKYLLSIRPRIVRG